MDNEYLAKRYATVAHRFHESPFMVNTYYNRIRTADTDLAAYYAEHRTLRTLKVPNINRLSKSILEYVIDGGEVDGVTPQELRQRVHARRDR